MEHEICVNLIANRHATMYQGQEVSESVWTEALSGAEMHDHHGLMLTALRWLAKLPNRKVQIRLFVTGLTAATVAFLKAYDEHYMNRPAPPSLKLMFYDRDSEDYSECVWND